MKCRLFLNSLTFAIGFLALAQLASAHAFVDHAEPKVGSTVSSAPKEVKVWFTQGLEPAYSRIQVFGPDGVEIDKKDTHIDKDDPHLLIVSLASAPAGTCKVQWKVTSVDTHRTQGDFKFTIESK